MKKETRIGILGGTFDPIHYAHLKVAENAQNRLGLNRVLFLLSATPPHKKVSEVTPFEVRWEMLCAACERHPDWVPTDLETRRAGPSYTIDTLHLLREESGPGTQWYLLMGMDCAAEFTTWKSWEEILSLVHLVVYRRKGDSLEKIDQRVRRQTILLEGEPMDVSSTEIRHRVSMGHSIAGLVPPEVEAIIREKGLYRSSRSLPLTDSPQDRETPGEVLV